MERLCEESTFPVAVSILKLLRASLVGKGFVLSPISISTFGTASASLGNRRPQRTIATLSQLHSSHGRGRGCAGGLTVQPGQDLWWPDHPSTRSSSSAAAQHRRCRALADPGCRASTYQAPWRSPQATEEPRGHAGKTIN